MASLFNSKFASFSLAFQERENSDAVGYAHLLEGGIFASIADGVGSARHGGDAARLAVAASLELADTQDMRALFSEVDSRINIASDGNHAQWSSTLSVCRVSDNVVKIGHVGDTRIYHLRGHGVQSRTSDQTEVERLIRDGVLTRERALRYPRRNILLSALNGKGDYELQETSFEFQSGDRLLLLSDGLYRQVSKREIATLSIANHGIQDFINALRIRLMENGVVDDSSALCVDLVIG